MKRLALTITLSFLLALPLLAPSPARAAANMKNWVDTGYPEEMYSARTSGNVSHSPYTVRTFQTAMITIIELILGAVKGITITDDIMQKDPKYVQELNQKSAVAGVSNYIAMMYTNPPADLALWIRDTGETLGFLPKQAHAQGVGFRGLAPLLPIWKAFRNIAYLLLAVVMIIIGFMVMLRKKIDPKTVVTVQNAIPRIVVALLLITFSYAIVGIFIEFMYLVILLAIALIKSTELLPEPNIVARTLGHPSVEQVFSRGGLITLFNTLFPWSDFSIADLAMDVVGWNALTSIVAGIAAGVVGLVIGGVPGAILGGALGAGGVPLLITFLLALALLYTFIRLFIMFLSAYIQIVFSTIVGPLHLLLVAVPGSTAFNDWLKNLIANMATFPIAGVMFMLAAAFATAADRYPEGIWTPPYLSVNFSVRNVAALFSIGVLMVIPTVVNGIKESIKAKPVIPVGTEAITAPISAVYGTTLTQISQLYYFQQFTKEGGAWLLELLGLRRK